ncbi:MAG: hypothetical protein ACF8LK_01200 [Phycisphaerales bacterium JB041]
MTGRSRKRRYLHVSLTAALMIVVTVAVTTPQSIRVPVVVASAVGFGVLLVIVTIAKVSKAAASKRAAAMAEACAQFGLTYESFDRIEQKDAAFAPFAHLSHLRTGGKGLAWIARNPEGSPPLVLLQHRYVVSTGQTTVQITHVLAALPCPPAWPSLSLTPEHLGHRLAGMLGKGDLRLENDEFNKRWFVDADDEDFAALVLSPPMQAWLVGVPKWATFHIGRGRVVCAAKKALKPEALAELVALCEEFAGSIAPELQAWIRRA